MCWLFTEVVTTPSPTPPTTEAQQASIAQETPKQQDSPPSVFKNSEPLREDQIQNAIKFLSHPRVRGSPVIHRRSFLERKGLTKEEIDEAFRRVPVSFLTFSPFLFLVHLQWLSNVNILIIGPITKFAANG